MKIEEIDKANETLKHKIIIVTKPIQQNSQTNEVEEEDTEEATENLAYQSKIALVQFGEDWFKIVLNKSNQTYLFTRPQVVKLTISNYFLKDKTTDALVKSLNDVLSDELEEKEFETVDINFKDTNRDNIEKLQNYVIRLYNGLMEFGSRFNRYNQSEIVSQDRELLDDIVDRATRFNDPTNMNEDLVVGLVNGRPYGAIDSGSCKGIRKILEKSVDPMLWFGTPITTEGDPDTPEGPLNQFI